MRGQFGGGLPSQNNDRARVLILAGLFFVLLLGTVGAVFLYSNTTKASVTKIVVEKEPEVKVAEVLVPIQPIPAGQALEPAMFRREQRPAVGLPARIVRDFEEIKGQYSRSLIVADQPLHRDYITAVAPTNQITVKIPDGYRAVTIAVNQLTGVEGWVRANARVDVLWISKIRGEAAVTVIVQNALILSADQQTESDNRAPAAKAVAPTTVTLLVTAQDAAKIQLAQTTGSLSLNLRGDQDPGKADATQGTSLTQGDLLGKKPDVAPVRPSGPIIKVKNKDGKEETFVFKDGSLVPFKEAAPVADR